MSTAAHPPEPEPSERSAPHAGTLERWALDYLRGDDLAARFTLGPPPRDEEPTRTPRDPRPTRPAPLRVLAPGDREGPKGKLSSGALRDPRRRVLLLHTLAHHELQAAELLCWALLAFPEAPRALRYGLARAARDEVRHLGLYDARLRAHGARFGDLPVRDWFWQRVPSAPTMASFLATLGLGFEGANLDHTARFAARLREAGDVASAEALELVQREEVPHVRLARAWFERLAGPLDGARYAAHLAPPLSPWLLRGTPLNRAARAAAGLSQPFLDELERWTYAPAPGS